MAKEIPPAAPYNQTHSAYLPILFSKRSRGLWLFFLSLVIYLTVRLVGIEDFPIYFFTDEAIQSVHAADLIRDGFTSEDEEFLPTFLVNGNQYNLSTSVYLQVLPLLLFGKQIWVTRGVSVLITLLAALSVGLFSRLVLNIKHGWMSILFLSIMPGWFLHSRTAFETVLAVTFFACFLLTYALYRTRNPNYLYGAVVFAALSFYSYSPAQVVIAVCVIALAFSDAHYHWQQRKTILWAFGLGLICLVPYFRFLINHPNENIEHLRILSSYWVQDISLFEKLSIYFKSYFSGLNPLYWFLPGKELIRHVMKGYGHLWRPAFPLIMIGLFYTFKNLRKSQYRILLTALLAAPSGAAVAEMSITRALFMVIPASLLAAIGVWKSAEWLGRQAWFASFNRFSSIFYGLVFLVLSFFNFYILQDALRNGPVWFTEYGLFGLQYSPKVVFTAVKDTLAQKPDTRLTLSPNWANGTDTLARYFFDDPLPFEFGSIDSFITEEKPLSRQDLLVMTPEEKIQMLESGKFKNIDYERILPYPNGQPGFYFTRLEYVDNISEIFAKEIKARRQLIQSAVLLQDNTTAIVEYSPLDMGEIKHVFDGDDFTLGRTWEANPFVLKLDFEKPYPVQTVKFRVGGEATQIQLHLWVEGIPEPILLEQNYPENPEPRTVVLELPRLETITRAELFIKDTGNHELAHVHLWEVEFLIDEN